MRAERVGLILGLGGALVACGTTGAPAASPVAPVPSAAASADPACVRECVASRQMEARAMWAIEADCARECLARKSAPLDK